MKKLFASAALAIIATVQAPTAGAQIETQLTMKSWNVHTNNGGGGWNATSTVGLGSITSRASWSTASTISDTSASITRTTTSPWRSISS